MAKGAATAGRISGGGSRSFGMRGNFVPSGPERASVSVGAPSSIRSRAEGSRTAVLTRPQTGPRLTLSNRNGSENRFSSADRKFTVRSFSGPTLDTDSSPGLNKASFTKPLYKPESPKKLSAYAESSGEKVNVSKRREPVPNAFSKTEPFNANLQSIDLRHGGSQGRMSQENLQTLLRQPNYSGSRRETNAQTVAEGRTPTYKTFIDAALKSTRAELSRLVANENQTNRLQIGDVRIVDMQSRRPVKSASEVNNGQTNIDPRLFSIHDRQPVTPNRQVRPSERFAPEIQTEKPAFIHADTTTRAEIMRQLVADVKSRDVRSDVSSGISANASEIPERSAIKITTLNTAEKSKVRRDLHASSEWTDAMKKLMDRRFENAQRQVQQAVAVHDTAVSVTHLSHRDHQVTTSTRQALEVVRTRNLPAEVYEWWNRFLKRKDKAGTASQKKDVKISAVSNLQPEAQPLHVNREQAADSQPQRMTIGNAVIHALRSSGVARIHPSLSSDAQPGRIIHPDERTQSTTEIQVRPALKVEQGRLTNLRIVRQNQTASAQQITTELITQPVTQPEPEAQPLQIVQAVTIQPDTLLQTKILQKVETVVQLQPKTTTVAVLKNEAQRLIEQEQLQATQEQVTVLSNTNVSQEQLRILQIQSETQARTILEIVLFSRVQDDEDVQYVVDQAAQKARAEQLARGVASAPTTIDGKVNGAAVIAATEEPNDNTMSALLKEQGATAVKGETQDGSDIEVRADLSEVGEMTQGEFLTIAQAEMEQKPAVRRKKEGKKVTDRDVKRVLYNAREVALAA